MVAVAQRNHRFTASNEDLKDAAGAVTEP